MSQQLNRRALFGVGVLAGTIAPGTAPASIWTHRCSTLVPGDVADRLRLRARTSGVALPALLFAASGLYMRHATGATDMVIGLTTSGRKGSRERVAVLANDLPLRLTLEPGMTLRDLARHASSRTRELLAHQRYRYGDLCRDLGPAYEGRPTSGLLVNVLPAQEAPRFGQCRTVTRNHTVLGEMDDLMVLIYDRQASGLRVDFLANPARYLAEENAAHQKRFLQLLEALAELGVETPIAQLDSVPV
ncbi:condensation domain-containing protein [Nonomuraea sp. NPDC001831]|uniref:condensation domain-containing protein n=1 Tax=Nonomuraea sp. NPDC001831 TaxID=3364340 RepID=UPI0036787DFA